MRLRMLAVLGTAVLTGSAAWAAPVQAEERDAVARLAPAVVTDGLTDPFGMTDAGRFLVVTEAGAGRVITVNKRTGRTRTAVRGLGPYAASGAARVGRSYAVVTGEADPSAPPGPVPGSSVLLARRGQPPRQLADLLAFELKHNPDRQTQFGPDGAPLDALSNPFAVIADPSRKGLVLVADGGGNSVLRVGRNGAVSAFFVPPTVNTGACRGLPNNDPATVGCDSVPTGLAVGRGGRVYISALTAEVPGEGRVYVVDATSGRLLKVISGFTSPTGVAVSGRGTLFVSELLEGAPAGEPGPGFDPSTVGQIVKVTRRGRSTAQVTMPIGLVHERGRLWSTAWSVAGLFLGAEGLGQVVRVKRQMFRPGSSPRRSAGPTGLGDALRPDLGR